MKRQMCVTLALTMVVMALGSCTSFRAENPQLRTYGRIRAERMAVAFRPTEWGAEDLGPATGEAYELRKSFFRIFDWHVEGDRPLNGKVEAFNFSKKPSELEMLAIQRAIDSVAGADALYVMSIQTTGKKSAVRGTRSVKVTGRALKLNDLGLMDEERWDLRVIASYGGSVVTDALQEKSGIKKKIRKGFGLLD